METTTTSQLLGLGQQQPQKVVPPSPSSFGGEYQLQKAPEEEEEEEEEEEVTMRLPWQGRRNSGGGGSHEEEKEEKVSRVIIGGGGGNYYALEPNNKEEDDDDDEEEDEGALLELRRRKGRSFSLPSSPSLAAARIFEVEDEAASSSSPSVVGGCCTKCKKRVQFADSLGLCLASVKHFSAAEEPQVPPAVLSRLQSFPMRRKDLEEFSAVLAALRMAAPSASASSTITMAPSSTQTPLRLEPILRPEAEEEMATMVSLEEVSGTAMSGAPSDVRGVVRVQKSPGPKEVTVRYTFNEWLSFLDTNATLHDDSHNDDNNKAPSDSSSEKYRFSLSLPPGLDEGTAVHFAICYRSQRGEFWDNNGGANYTLKSTPKDPQD